MNTDPFYVGANIFAVKYFFVVANKIRGVGVMWSLNVEE